MTRYLGCIKAHRGTNDDECRLLSKAYLQCRMERNLMARDEMRNLGYQDTKELAEASRDAQQTETEDAVRQGRGEGAK